MLEKCLGKNKIQTWSTAGTLYQVLMDKERTLKLKKTIKGTVRKGDVVVDIGTGSGILACFAIEAKAKFVYAIEMDPSNYRAASIVIQNNGMEDVIELIHADALEVKLPKKVDVVMW